MFFETRDHAFVVAAASLLGRVETIDMTETLATLKMKQSELWDKISKKEQNKCVSPSEP